MATENYLAGVALYLDRNIDKLDTHLQLCELEPSELALLRARRDFLSGDTESFEVRLLEFDQAQCTSQRLMGDRFFLEGRHRYLLGDSSRELFLRAALCYEDSCDNIYFLRSLLNACYAAMLSAESSSGGSWNEIESLISTIRKNPESPKLGASLAHLECRIAFCQGQYERVLELCVREQANLGLREKILLRMSHVEALLLLKKDQEAGDVLKALQDAMPSDPDLKQTLEYLSWRFCGSGAMPHWNPNGVANSFSARARAFYHLSQGGTFESFSSNDPEIRLWKNKTHTAPPEFTRHVRLEHEDLQPLAHFRSGSQALRVLEWLEKEGESSKWTLLSVLFPSETSETALRKREHHLHVLVSQINSRCPGLIESVSSSYRLTKRIAKRGAA